MGDILALGAVVTENAHGKALRFEFAAGQVDQVADPGCRVLAQAQVGLLKSEGMNFNALNDAHGGDP